MGLFAKATGCATQQRANFCWAQFRCVAVACADTVVRHHNQYLPAAEWAPVLTQRTPAYAFASLRTLRMFRLCVSGCVWVSHTRQQQRACCKLGTRTHSMPGLLVCPPIPLPSQPACAGVRVRMVVWHEQHTHSVCRKPSHVCNLVPLGAGSPCVAIGQSGEL